MVAFKLETEHDCACCGMPVYINRPECFWCTEGDCDPGQTWHCDGRNGHCCDGTSCDTYSGVMHPDNPMNQPQSIMDERA